MAKQTPKRYVFPKDFVFSCATSAYQVEGAAYEDGKGLGNWDVFCRVPGAISDGTNAEIACDSYHKYQEDVKLLKNLGVQQYRFSISWPRVLPDGTLRIINQPGIDYYNKLIDELVKNGIEPMATLFHWDLPQALQDQGGLLNPRFVDWFADYAKLCFEKFGDRVKKWATINEPYIISSFAYGPGNNMMTMAPGSFGRMANWTRYISGHHILLAHAKAYHVYKNEFKAKQQGECGIVLAGMWCDPATNDEEDMEASERAFDFIWGWFANPIFHPDGDYPKRMKDRILERSKQEGRVKSRLPEFTKEEIEMIKGSADFLGFNHYMGLSVRNRKPDEYTNAAPIDDLDGGYVWTIDAKYKMINPPNGWININPEAFYRHLNFLRIEYGNTKVMITENGCMDHLEEGLEDVTRIEYVREHLIVLLRAIDDGCNVIGYTLWSLVDNFEWTNGYTMRFGIHYVDFNDPELKRVPKASAKWYKKVIQNRAIEEDPESAQNIQKEIQNGMSQNGHLYIN